MSSAIGGFGSSVTGSGVFVVRERRLGEGLGYWNFDNQDSPRWVEINPVDESKLTPYIPEDNSTLIEASKQTPIQFDSDQIPAHYPLDQIAFIFSKLTNFKDIANGSLVCKRFYAASKSPQLWQLIFKNSYPNLKTLSPCMFSADNQFKIVFQRISSELKQVSEMIEKAKKFPESAFSHYKLRTNFKKSDDPLINAFIQVSHKHSHPKKNILEELESSKEQIVAKYNTQEKFEKLIKSTEMQAMQPSDGFDAKEVFDHI